MNDRDTNPAYPHPVEILLVEDSPADIALTEEALLESKLHTNLNTVTDGEAAMAFLRREEPYASAPRPDLVLLDLNLPRKNGREVLYEIKRDEQLRDIPVIVLTISTAEEDIMTAYRLQANCYVIKPVNLDNFFRVLNSVARYWLSSGRTRDGEGHGG